MESPDIAEQLRTALQHYQAGERSRAERLYREILGRDPSCADALHYLGEVCLQSGRLDEAIACFQRALARRDSAPSHYHLGLALAARQEFKPAIFQLRQAIALQPEFSAAHALLGGLLKLHGQLDAAIASLQRALELDPNSAETHYNLGISEQARGRVDAAVACFRRAVQLSPGFAAAHNNLGAILEARGQLDAALTCFQTALDRDPQFAEAHYNLANLARRRGQIEDAIAAYRRATALNPTLADAHNNLGVLYKERSRFDDALAAYRRALEVRPDFVDAHNNLGNLLKEQGNVEEAIGHYRRALALQPDRPDIHSNLIFALHYHPGGRPEPIEAELLAWNERHVRPLAASIPLHVNERLPDRRLRIGYVSPDFCHHAVGFNLVPLFEHHARDRFEIVCYSDVTRADALTERFRSWSDCWRDTAGRSHEQLAATVREDGIDVLVDLALHTANNRLPVFARKPAPVQISFAGYPGRTGLETIDAHLTDPHLEPRTIDLPKRGDVPFHLPATFWCYAPLATDPPVSPLPAMQRGQVTFGCLNNFGKVNLMTLGLWARVLGATPASRLVLHSPEGRHRERAVACLGSSGVDPHRIEFVGPQSRHDYLATYHRIDLGLDTFPYNGHTTSLDSVWMGVPVISLVGQTTVGRAGWSQLSNLGLSELAASSTGDFVRLASTLACNLPRLAEWRATLRARMQRSPLMDAARFAHGIEEAYRTLWRQWCERKS
jgi:protein O-GlcNAc transferase